MIRLATNIPAHVVLNTFPEELENDNEQPDEANGAITEQEQEDEKD